MTSLRQAAVYQVLLIAALLIELAVYYPKLPDRVASHFDFTGTPDSWMPKQSFATFAVVFPAMLAGFMLLAQAVTTYMDRVPDALINMPNKKYWLAPERRDETLAYIVPIMSRMMLWVGTGTTALVVILMGMTLRTNLTPEPKTTYAMPLAILFVVLVLTMSLRATVRIYRRFGRIPPTENLQS